MDVHLQQQHQQEFSPSVSTQCFSIGMQTKLTALISQKEPVPLKPSRNQSRQINPLSGHGSGHAIS